MTDLATFNFKLPQLYPGAGEHRLNTCGNPDCLNFGVEPTDRTLRRSEWALNRPDFTPAQLDIATDHGPGAYKLSGSDKQYRRKSQVFDYETNPHEWIDQRTIRCKSLTPGDKLCNSGFSILSPDHLDEEITRLRNHNGVLDGPACGACGVRFLERPEDFTMKGAHQRTKDRNGNPIGI